MDDVYEEPGPYPAVPAYKEETMPFRIRKNYDDGELDDGDPDRVKIVAYIKWLQRELELARFYRNTIADEQEETGDE